MNAFYGVTGALDIFNRADPRMAINSEQEQLVRERLIEALPLPARQADQVPVWQLALVWQQVLALLLGLGSLLALVSLLALAWQRVLVLLLTPVSQPVLVLLLTPVSQLALAWQLLEAQAR